LPVIIIFLNLLISVYPRYPRAGPDPFPISRKTDPADFAFVEDTQRDLESSPGRCALFSRILWWKNITLQIAYVVAMATLVAAAILLFVTHL